MKNVIALIITAVLIIGLQILLNKKQYEKEAKLVMENRWMVAKFEKRWKWKGKWKDVYILCLIKDGKPIYDCIISEYDANKIKRNGKYNFCVKKEKTK